MGCGDGIVSQYVPDKCDYQGLDINNACIYEQRHDNPKVRYIHASKIQELMRQQARWDMILLLDVIEHTRDFTSLFELSMSTANQYVVVSLPNELFIVDRLRMLFGKELNAHSLDLVNKPEGFKHQFIINIFKARLLLTSTAGENGFQLYEEVLRPIQTRRKILQPVAWTLTTLTSPQLWSQGSIFIFKRMNNK